MPDLVSKRTGQPVFVPPEALADAIASGLYEAPSGDQRVAVEVRPGLVGETTLDSLGAVHGGAAELESEQSFRGRERSARLDREHGGIIEGGLTLIESGLDSASFGLTGAIGDAVGGEEYRENRLDRQEARPTLAAVGNVAGAVAPSLLTGGGSLARVARATPMGQAARLGARIAKTADGASDLSKVVRAGAGASVEGAVQGVGSAIQQLRDEDAPLTAERALSVLGSNVLTGGAVGGIAGAAGKGLERGLTKAKSAIDDIAKRARANANIGDDLSSLDAAGLNRARDTEVERLVTEQNAAKATTVDDLRAYQATVKEGNPWLVIDQGESAAMLNKSRSSLRNALNDPDGLAKNPATALKSLRIQEQALLRASNEADDIAAKLASTNNKIATDLGKQIGSLAEGADEVVLSGKAARRYGTFADVRVGKGKDATVTLKRAEAEAFHDALTSGKIAGQSDAALKKLPDLIEANRALQTKIESASIAKTDLVSDRLKAIADAKDALTTGRGPKSLPEQMLGGAVFSTVAGAVAALPIPGTSFLAPMAGAKAASLVGEKVFGRALKASADAAERASRGVAAFMDVTRKAEKVAPVLASKVLTSAAFGGRREEPSTTTKPQAPQSSRPVRLAHSFRARANELRSMMEVSETGAPRVRRAVRARIAEQLASIGSVHPVLADRMEGIAVRRLEYLAARLPKEPALGMQTGPDGWQPSELAMRSWARHVAAVEDPGAIVERLAHGTVTPEDASAMREVYPEMYADIQRQIIEALPTLQRKLPYKRRLALSVFSGVPVDAAYEPKILRVLQASFTDEPGTEGGMQAPKPMPAFGSVKVHDATLTQERAGLRNA